RHRVLLAGMFRQAPARQGDNKPPPVRQYGRSGLSRSFFSRLMRYPEADHRDAERASFSAALGASAARPGRRRGLFWGSGSAASATAVSGSAGPSGLRRNAAIRSTLARAIRRNIASSAML